MGGLTVNAGAELHPALSGTTENTFPGQIRWQKGFLCPVRIVPSGQSLSNSDMLHDEICLCPVLQCNSVGYEPMFNLQRTTSELIRLSGMRTAARCTRQGQNGVLQVQVHAAGMGNLDVEAKQNYQIYDLKYLNVCNREQHFLQPDLRHASNF